MRYVRIERLVKHIDSKCRPEGLVHAKFAATMVAAVVALLAEYGEEELADRLEVILVDRVLPALMKLRS